MRNKKDARIARATTDPEGLRPLLALDQMGVLLNVVGQPKVKRTQKSYESWREGRVVDGRAGGWWPGSPLLLEAQERLDLRVRVGLPRAADRKPARHARVAGR